MWKTRLINPGFRGMIMTTKLQQPLLVLTFKSWDEGSENKIHPTMAFLLSPKSPAPSSKETSSDCMTNQPRQKHRAGATDCTSAKSHQQNKLPSKIKHFAMQRKTGLSRWPPRKQELSAWMFKFKLFPQTQFAGKSAKYNTTPLSFLSRAFHTSYRRHPLYCMESDSQG